MVVAMTVTQFPPDFSLRAHTVLAFPTPIVAFQWPDSAALNADLRDTILAAEKDRTGIVASNVGGWHSDTDLFDWPDACIRDLRARIQATASELVAIASGREDAVHSAQFGFEAWANVVRSGDFHSVHKHANYMWSGVYYVAIGNPDPDRVASGHIEFIDPRDAAGMVSLPEMRFSQRQVIPPQAGLMLIFPAWLKHYVHPYFGDGERISISFNIIVLDLQVANT